MSRTVTLVTYNVWFGDYFKAERTAALLDILRRSNADVIGLQEATPRLRRVIEATDWLADGYQISEFSVAPYGVLLLSRLPVREFSIHALPTGMGRSLVLVELEASSAGAGDQLVVGAVHLESLGYADLRRQQLERIFPILEGHPHAVLMGDFNMCSTWAENRHLHPAYTDIWAHLRPDEPGWTEDTDINEMRLLVSRKPTQVRFDRIILRSHDALWQPTAIERLGNEPVPGDIQPLFPSDHFGLRAVLRYGQTSA